MDKKDIQAKISEYRDEISQLKAALSRAIGWRRATIVDKISEFEDMVEDLREMIGEVEL